MLNGKRVVLTNWTTGHDIQFVRKAFSGEFVEFVPYPKNLDNVDLVYLTGGADVDPARYDGNASLCGQPEKVRDVWDLRYIPDALERNIPIFGICRGSQTLWVVLGGRLKEEVFPAHWDGFFGNKHHRLAGAWGDVLVNSFHHQAPYGENRLGVVPRLKSVDGLTEAFTYKDNVCGVQWHPEWMHHKIYVHLLQATIQGQINLVMPMFHQL